MLLEQALSTSKAVWLLKKYWVDYGDVRNLGSIL